MLIFDLHNIITTVEIPLWT